MSTPRKRPARARWRRFIEVGILVVIAGLFLRDADAGLATVVFVVGGALIFAGLIGGAVGHDENTDRPR